MMAYGSAVALIKCPAMRLRVPLSKALDRRSELSGSRHLHRHPAQDLLTRREIQHRKGRAQLHSCGVQFV